LYSTQKFCPKTASPQTDPGPTPFFGLLQDHPNSSRQNTLPPTSTLHIPLGTTQNLNDRDRTQGCYKSLDRTIETSMDQSNIEKLKHHFLSCISCSRTTCCDACCFFATHWEKNFFLQNQIGNGGEREKENFFIKKEGNIFLAAKVTTPKKLSSFNSSGQPGRA
jgi:hypothetical protein